MGSVYEYVQSKGPDVNRSIVSLLIGKNKDEVGKRIDKILESELIKINKPGASFEFCIHIDDNNYVVLFSPNYTEFYIPHTKVNNDNTEDWIKNQITIELSKRLDRHLSGILFMEHKEVVVKNIDNLPPELGFSANIGNVQANVECPHKIHHLTGIEKFFISCRIK